MNSCVVCGRFCLDSYKFCAQHVNKYVYYPQYKLCAARANRRISKCQTSLFLLVRDLFHKKTFQEVIFEFTDERWRYDIVVPDLNLICEMDGAQHFKFIKMFHKTKGKFKESVETDKEKSKIAEKQGYKVVRFSYIEKLTPEYVHNKIMYHIGKI